MKTKLISSLLAAGLLVSATACSKADVQDTFSTEDSVNSGETDVTEAVQTTAAAETSEETVEETEEQAMLIKTRKAFLNGVPAYVDEYDLDGNIVKGTNYDSEGNVRDSFEFEYSATGKAISQVRYLPSGEIFDTAKFEYDASDKLLKGTFYSPDGAVRALYEYEYEDGLLVGDTYTGEGPNIRHDYEYNQNGSLVKESKTVEDPYNYSWIVYSYDATGMLETAITYTDHPNTPDEGIEDEDWDKTEEYEHDALGNVTKMITTTNRGDGQIEKVTVVYEYNSDGRLIKETSTDTGIYDQYSEAPAGRTEEKLYEYDEYGNYTRSGEYTFEYTFY